jgi:hypothetical protein
LSPPPAPPPKIDLAAEARRKGAGAESVEGGQTSLEPVSSRSLAWAGVVKPFTWFLLVTLAVAMALPFVLIACLPLVGEESRIGKTIEWAHTILPPLVGFAGAIVGYYFGTRSGKGETEGGGGS